MGLSSNAVDGHRGAAVPVPIFLAERQCEVETVKQEAVTRETAIRERGILDWCRDDFGYGFLKRENGGQLFAHYSEIEMDGFKTLSAGQVVSFVVVATPKGLAAREIVFL